MPDLKKEWILSQEAFQRLLRYLDDGGDSAGERYLEIRRRLTAYFDRKNCRSSDELTDETLNRIARKLQEKGTITDVGALQYCYIVAKFVFLESLRRQKPLYTGPIELAGADSATLHPTNLAESSAEESKEKIFACLERCLGELDARDRELILEYYRGEQRTKIERRSALAARLGLSSNALSIRACRIRNRLESCVRARTLEA